MQNLNYPGAADSAPFKLQAASIGIIGLGRMGQVFGELLIGSGAQVLVATCCIFLNSAYHLCSA